MLGSFIAVLSRMWPADCGLDTPEGLTQGHKEKVATRYGAAIPNKDQNSLFIRKLTESSILGEWDSEPLCHS